MGNVSLWSDQVPGAENFKMGDKVLVTIEIEVTGMHKADSWDVKEYGMPASSFRISNDIMDIVSVKKKPKPKKAGGFQL